MTKMEKIKARIAEFYPEDKVQVNVKLGNIYIDQWHSPESEVIDMSEKGSGHYWS